MLTHLQLFIGQEYFIGSITRSTGHLQIPDVSIPFCQPLLLLCQHGIHVGPTAALRLQLSILRGGKAQLSIVCASISSTGE